MRLEDFLGNVDWMQKHIEACKTDEQLDNMQRFYEMVISKEWYPDVSLNSITNALMLLDVVVDTRKINIMQVL